MKCPKCNLDNPDDSKFCKDCGTNIISAEEAQPSITKTIETHREELTTGSSFAGRYQIIEELGEGGMGKIYKALDTKINEKIAIKLIKPEIASDKKIIERFSNELKIARKIGHRNVGRMFHLGEEEGTHFITMEYVPGQDLKGLIRQSAPLSITRSISIAKQICEGLSEAHRLGVIHRDLKPSNIMIDKSGNARIMDFGIARTLKTKGITGSGVMIGTPEYMSPEQVEGKEVDQRSDIYSLGVILYEMVTGRVPFEGDTPLSVAIKQKGEIPKNPKELNAQISEDLSRVVLKCMEKDKKKRYRNTEGLLSELEKIKSPIAASITVSEWKNSIAVLPFINMSADPEQEYFCDGISEELINSLTQISDLRIVARTSAFSFKGKDVDINEIGRKLKVDKVLEGSVRKAGNRLRITAQLINVADGYHLWSERYDREMEDVFVIQDEITLAIVDKLKIKLLGKEKQGLVKHHTDNQEAYSFYLKGRYFWNKMNPGGYQKAIENFEQAIEKDPNNAAAYAGLADSYWWSSFWGNLPPRQTFPKAREAIQKAIEIDDTLGDAHASLASILAIYDWDWENAEQEFKRAIDLAPGSAYIYVYYSIFLTLRKRFDEAVIQSKKAQSLDPVSGLCSIHVGHVLYHARRYDEAIEEFQKRLVIEPNDWFARHHLSEVYLEKSRIKEALAEIDKSVELSGGVPMNLASAAMTHYRFGDKEVADSLFEKLKSRAGQEYIQPIAFAFIHWVREEMDQAFEWVKKAYEERDSFLPWIRVTPTDSWQIPKDPRIDELLDRWGLP